MKVEDQHNYQPTGVSLGYGLCLSVVRTGANAHRLICSKRRLPCPYQPPGISRGSRRRNVCRILKCHVLVDLKLEAFSHENIGQLNTYIAWYDKNIRVEGDNPPVGILLCTERDHALVEYATAAMTSDLFVSKYQLELPSKELPQKEIEAERKRLEGGA